MTEPVEPFSDEMYGSIYPKPTEDELKTLYSKYEELLNTIPEDQLYQFAFAESKYDENMEELEAFLNTYYLEIPF